MLSVHKTKQLGIRLVVGKQECLWKMMQAQSAKHWMSWLVVSKSPSESELFKCMS